MSSLVRQEILWNLQMGNLSIDPYIPEHLGPDTYDLTLGPMLLVETYGGPYEYSELNISPATQSEPFYLRPGEFCLAATVETVTLPANISANLTLRSTWARAGLNHSLAGHVDPGWYGVLTLELKNIKSRHIIPLWPGMRLAQLEFIQKNRLTDRDYSAEGHSYYGSTTVRGPVL